MSSNRLWKAMGRGWWMLALGAALGLLGGAAVLVSVPKEYTAQAKVLMQPSGRATGLESHDLLAANLPTYVELGTSDATIAAIGLRIDDGASTADVRSRLSFVAEEDTPIITVSGSAPDAMGAARLTEAAAEVLQQSISSQDAAVLKASSQIISRAAEPKVPTTPNPLIVLPAGLILGLLVGFIAAVAWELGHRRPRTVGELRQAADLDVLGVLGLGRSRLARSAERCGIPTTREAVTGRLRRAGQHDVTLVPGEGSTPAGVRAMVLSTAAGCPSPRVAEDVADLDLDAQAVLVVDAGCSRPGVARFARSVRGQGVDVVGLLVVPRRKDVPETARELEATREPETVREPEAERSAEQPERPEQPGAEQPPLREPQPAASGPSRSERQTNTGAHAAEWVGSPSRERGNAA